MIIFKKIIDLQKYLAQQTQNGAEIGFIPTMGALHDGHLSLVRQANQKGNLSVCSIFVNPTQFNDKKDLALYPVSVESDIEMLVLANCDVLFLPDVDEMYPQGFASQTAYDFGYVETILEGAHRRGHFKGVGQVVGRFFEIIHPRQVYMGQKDYQQCLVIIRLAEIMGLKDTNINICPTIRESDGLAMSSRNRRLSGAPRENAITIFHCLNLIKDNKNSVNFESIKSECANMLLENGFDTEYIALADARTLTPLDNYDVKTPMVALIAARLGEIRLIDNMLL